MFKITNLIDNELLLSPCHKFIYKRKSISLLHPQPAAGEGSSQGGLSSAQALGAVWRASGSLVDKGPAGYRPLCSSSGAGAGQAV